MYDKNTNARLLKYIQNVDDKQKCNFRQQEQLHVCFPDPHQEKLHAYQHQIHLMVAFLGKTKIESKKENLYHHKAAW